MSRPTFEDVLAAWTADYDSVEQENEEMLAQELNLSTTSCTFCLKEKRYRRFGWPNGPDCHQSRCRRSLTISLPRVANLMKRAIWLERH